MSPSRSARHVDDRNALTGLDVLLGIALHLVVVAAIVLLAWWHGHRMPEPMQRIEVRMISAQQLARMQHPKRAPKARPTPAKKTKSKPVPKLHAKSKGATHKQSKEEAFNPFVPLESSTDTQTETSSAPNRDLANLMEQQLSHQELDRYIAMMRDAVQRHWKVPAGVSEATKDPLVEVELHPDGSVASVQIIESSGNAALDRTLIAAIQAAAPFQVPRRQFEAFRVNRIRFHPLK